MTVWGCISALKPAPELVGSAAGFFPLVGLILGFFVAFTNYILTAYVEPKILNLFSIALMITVTGALPLAGLKHAFDMSGSLSMDARGNGILGFTAVVLALLFKSAALDSMDELLTSSLLLTPVWARWGLVIFLYGFSARFDGRGRLIAERITIWSMLASTVAVLAVAAYFFGRKGLWISLAISVFVLFIRGLLSRNHTELSEAHGNATIELSETLTLVLLAAL